jgi:hypothetical protein
LESKLQIRVSQFVSISNHLRGCARTSVRF